jgi:hypothetical protein
LPYENKAGCGQKNLFGIKKIVIQANGPIDLEIRGNDYFSLIKVKDLICIKKK